MQGDSRYHPRWHVGEGPDARVSPDHPVSILDISLGGVRIEHSNLLLPGTLAFLTLSVHGGEVSAACRVIRSTIHRFEVWPTGEQIRTYRTGLKFVALPEDSRRLLDVYIDLLRQHQETRASA